MISTYKDVQDHICKYDDNTLNEYFVKFPYELHLTIDEFNELKTTVIEKLQDEGKFEYSYNFNEDFHDEKFIYIYKTNKNFELEVLRTIKINISIPFDVLIDDAFMSIMSDYEMLIKYNYNKKLSFVYNYGCKKFDIFIIEKGSKINDSIILDSIWIDREFTIENLKQKKEGILNKLKDIQEIIQLSLVDVGEQDG